MNDQNKVFASEYIIDFNATQAAKRAGYSEKTAYSIGQRLLKNVEVRKEIDKQINIVLNSNREILKKKLIDELETIAFHDVSKDIQVKTVKETRTKYDTKGNPNGEEEVEYQKVVIIDTELSEQTRAISSIKQNEKGAIEVKYHDKKGAIELLGKYLTLFTDKVEHSGEIVVSRTREETKARIAEIEERLKG